MTLRLVISPRALAELDSIWDYGARTWGAPQADAYIRGLHEVLGLLCDNPDIARLRPQFSPPAPVHPYRSHVLIYRTDSSRLEVIRLPHSRSNWSALLSRS